MQLQVISPLSPPALESASFAAFTASRMDVSIELFPLLVPVVEVVREDVVAVTVGVEIFDLSQEQSSCG